MQSHSVADCWEGHELLFHPVQMDGCAVFLAEQKTYISCVIDVATVSIIKFTDTKGAYTVFMLDAEQQLLASQKVAVPLR